MLDAFKSLFEGGNSVAEAMLTSDEIRNGNISAWKRFALIVKLATVVGSIVTSLLFAGVVAAGYLKKAPQEGGRLQEELRRQDERLRSIESKHAEEIRMLRQGPQASQIVPVQAGMAAEIQKQLTTVAAPV